jgi:hypothetical protein
VCVCVCVCVCVFERGNVNWYDLKVLLSCGIYRDKRFQINVNLHGVAFYFKILATAYFI